MRLSYLKSITRTEPATPTYLTYDDKIKPGNILVLRSITGTYTGIGADHYVRFFVEIGEKEYSIGGDTPGTNGGVVAWSGCVPVGEGCRVGIETKESLATNVVALHIVGELWDSEAWRKANS